VTFPRVIRLDADGDADTTGGRLHLTETLREYVAQTLSCRLKFLLGEWFLDVKKGTPMFRYILGVKNPDVEFIKSVFGRVIRGTTGVAEIVRLDVKLDKRTRKCSVDFEVMLVNGETFKNQGDHVSWGDT